MASEVNLLTLVTGPFLGATLAFVYNRYVEREKRFQEQLSAANLTLLIVKYQYGEFLLFRRIFRDDIARVAVTGNEPLWHLVRPTFLKLGDYSVDYKSIGFLMKSAKMKAIFDKIEQVQILHRDLTHMLALANEQARLKQQKIATLHSKNPSASWKDMENELGLDVVALLSEIAVAFALRSVKNESNYVEAFTGLRSEVSDHLSSYSKLKFCFCDLPWIGKKNIDELLISLDAPKPGFSFAELSSLPYNMDKELKQRGQI